MGNYVRDPNPCAKFHNDPITPFRPPNIRKFASSDSQLVFYSSDSQGGALKMQDMKMQDVEMTDRVARHENAGHENERRENAGCENDGPCSKA